LLKACQEFECRAAQAGTDLTGIVFATHSNDDKMWIVLSHQCSDDVAGSSESGLTSGMHAEIRLEIGQYRAQRSIRALCTIPVALTGGAPPEREQIPIGACTDKKKIGTPLIRQLTRPHHCAVRRGGQIGRNENSLQDRHDAHRPASDTLLNTSVPRSFIPLPVMASPAVCLAVEHPSPPSGARHSGAGDSESLDRPRTGELRGGSHGKGGGVPAPECCGAMAVSKHARATHALPLLPQLQRD